MIEDMTSAILEISSPFTKVSVTKIDYGGSTYDGEEVTEVLNGSLQPLEPEEKEHLVSLGYTLNGKMKFYLPVSEGTLDANDIIVDTGNARWKCLPEKSDYADLAGYIKYILEKDMI